MIAFRPGVDKVDRASFHPSCRRRKLMFRSWTAAMFVWAVLGSLAALFWPWLIAIWRRESNDFFRWVAPETPAAGKALYFDQLSGPPVVRLALKLLIWIVSAFVFDFR